MDAAATSNLLPSSTSSSFDFADVHDSTTSEEKGGKAHVGQAIVTGTGAKGQTTVKAFEDRRRPYQGAGDEKECVSCSISIPQRLSDKLPPGAPGSPKANGNGQNGSPTLRSKEPLHVYDSPFSDSDTEEDEPDIGQSPKSFTSNTSTSSYHTHTLQYITTSNPIDPTIFSVLRKVVLRTFTCEQLPRGLTAGKLAFGDPVSDCTIAYKFRLSDPCARGGYRRYALIALAGTESASAHRAMALIWKNFQRIADWMTAEAEKTIRRSQQAEQNSRESSEYPPISSFLTVRRNCGSGMRARGLTEMMGDEKFFAELHLKFVSLLRDLRWRFG